ncbi:MAG: hypothetical protein WED00_12675 [Aquisalimonadaceae bacterium]
MAGDSLVHVPESDAFEPVFMPVNGVCRNASYPPDKGNRTERLYVVE